MSNSYNLTQKIHELLPKINQKYGLEFEVGAKFYIDLEKEERNLKALIERCKEDPTIENALYIQQQELRIKNWKLDPDYFDQEITEKQLRQILVGLSEILGENPEILIFKKQIEKDNNQVKQLENKNEWAKVYKTHKEGLEIILNLTPQSQAEVLCQKWLDGLTPLFNQDPEMVLTELVEILENLLK